MINILGNKRKRIGTSKHSTKKLISVPSNDILAGEHGYTILSTKSFIYGKNVKTIARSGIGNEDMTIIFVK